MWLVNSNGIDLLSIFAEVHIGKNQRKIKTEKVTVRVRGEVSETVTAPELLLLLVS